MPAPRPSQSAEAARAAALQAEFNEKRWVWVPDEREGYLAGWVNKEEENVGEVIMASGGEIRRVWLDYLSKMNPPKFDRVEDIADLTFLNEASVVHNLRLRYGSGAIYTYSGLFLVAINPYQSLPLYSDVIVQQYRNKRRDENPPHIFAVAERAWVNMGEERENQSILITGESGAGKTESTKKVIQYLAAIATDVYHSSPNHSQSPSITSTSMPSNGLPRQGSSQRGLTLSSSSSQSLTAKGRLGLLERQILQANPVLEAFGNAQTQRNNNSSRFGKFVRISFAPDGSIAGANIDWYLLEKSRVVVRSEAERSFHVFYMLLVGGRALKDTLLLDGGVEDYEYLNKSRREVDGVDDREEWNALKNALDTVGFTPAEQFDLFRVVAAILHIGNIEITSTRADDAVMPDPSQAERVCHLLGIPVSDFMRAVLRPRVLAGREWVSQARTRQQALDELAALCKTLYEKSFGLLVDRINRALDRPSSKSTFIGVLDIAGFEIFETNTYEQLLINYTNEKLQQFFNHHMFVLEQEEYAREGIEWDYVNFGLDLQPTIDLIETSGVAIGVLSCLDEECIMPKATDLTFTNKLNHLWAGELQAHEEPHPGRGKYEPTRFEQGFVIQHYAGKVEYHTDGWLEKNKDPLNDNLTRVLSSSAERYVASMFSEYGEPVSSVSSTINAFSVGKKRGIKRGAFRTVGQRHKEQLSILMEQLQATQPHFVRCIVPNNNKKPGRIDVPLVLDQLRCNGVLEGIRIARLGYPNRLPFVEFRYRYEVITPGIIPHGYMDGRKACLRMVEALELDRSLFRVGTSKIFFKAGVLAELEERRDALLFDVFTKLQAVARMWTARRQMKKILNRAVAIRTIQRNARVYGDLKDWPWWQLYIKVRPLLAATRNDEELRKKDAELQLVKERAEWDKRERQSLESLKMTLEKEKQKVEDALASERALGVDKDALLERSKRREGELEEEVTALQADLDTLDSQLDGALKIQKECEEKYETLRLAFDQAADHLVRLESEQQEWNRRDTELTDLVAAAQQEIGTLQQDKEELQKVSEELTSLVGQREQDLSRAKERMEAAIGFLENKLHDEIKHKDAIKDRSTSLEEDTRHAKDQLAEMARTATQYSTLIQKKEEENARILNELSSSKREKDQASRQLTELQAGIDSLSAELEAQKGDRERSRLVRAKLQEELDELRTLMDAKVSEETRRSEAEKSKEQELVDLRRQASKLQSDLNEARRQGNEGQSKLKAEVGNLTRAYNSLEASHKSLLDRERTTQANLTKVEAGIAEMEKTKRTLESELQSVRSRQIDADGQLAEAIKTKEGLERQLAHVQSKCQEFEDTMLQLEREKSASDRQLEASRKQLEAELSKRTQLEQLASRQKTELVQLRDRTTKYDRELNKVLTDLKNREWDVKQLESKQDKTIVEHVHVLEEAKRVTDRQLADAQTELQKNAAYIRSLEKSKTRLAGEAEDLVRQTERERVELRSKEKAAKAQEEKAALALADFQNERRAKEAAELTIRRLQSDLKDSQGQVSDVNQQLHAVQRAKENLETELERLAGEPQAPSSMAKIQRQYETRIAELERKLEDFDSVQVMAARIKEQVDRQHTDIRRLIMSDGHKDEQFQKRLLRELQLADEELQMEMSSRSRNLPGNKTATVYTLSNVTPTKNGTPRSRKSSQPTIPRTSDSQVTALQQHVQILELRIVASERVRKHLENSLREMTAELENGDGSKQFIQQYRARLTKENGRLAELLDEESQARRAAEAAHIDGVQVMWDKVQQTIADEQESYTRLEESKKALQIQQRATQVELEEYRSQVGELSRSKKQFQLELSNLKEKLELEMLAKNEEINARRQLQARLQELEITSSTSSTIQSELREAVESYKEKANSYMDKLEAAEIARSKATRAEAFVRKTLSEVERAHSEALTERSAAEQRLQLAEKKISDLETKLDEEGRESSDLDMLSRRLSDELEEERKQHLKDLADRDFTTDQTRKKYQAELAQLSEELLSQRDSMTRLREDNRKVRSDYDELQLRYDDEVYNGTAWKKEKERLDTKIDDLNKAYEAAIASQGEQQTQIVALHSQVRELRGVLSDAESERSLLQKARRALQAELESIKLDSVDANKMSTDREYQKLQLKKQDLERSLEEQEDRVGMAFDRMKKAEAHANECQVELEKIRMENSELDKENARLDKQLKELNVRIVDFETKAYGSSPRPTSNVRRLEARIEELTNQLNQVNKDKGESSRIQRSVDKVGRDTQFQLAESDRQRARLEEERKAYETQLEDLRQAMDAIQTEESNLQLAKRRAEREAADFKQKALNLEREVERLRNRLDRPTSSVLSPTSSPRKFES